MNFNIMNSIDYKVGIYIRLSREDEEKEKYQESESIGNQRTLLMQYIKENKLNFISEYVDDSDSNCISINSLREQLSENGYIFVETEDRTELFVKDGIMSILSSALVLKLAKLKMLWHIKRVHDL